MTDRPRAFVISEDADDMVACYAAVSSPDRWVKFSRSTAMPDPDSLTRMAITLHLNRRGSVGAPSPPTTSATAVPVSQQDLTAQVAYGETRTSREGKVSHYAGLCASCGKPAWISRSPWLGEGKHTCPRCYAASRGAKA
jgi:hypothetical protein